MDSWELLCEVIKALRCRLAEQERVFEDGLPCPVCGNPIEEWEDGTHPCAAETQLELNELTQQMEVELCTLLAETEKVLARCTALFEVNRKKLLALDFLDDVGAEKVDEALRSSKRVCDVSKRVGKVGVR